MLDASNVIHLHRQPDMTSGHNNPPTFEDDVAAVLAAGTLQVAWDRVRIAVRDPRLLRQHLKVLVELLDCASREAGTAWPSRETLAERCGLHPRSVQNILYTLRKLHYIAWEQRPIPSGSVRVQYTVPLAHADYDFLRTELERYLSNLSRLHSPQCKKPTQPAVQTKAHFTGLAQPAVQRNARPAVQQYSNNTNYPSLPITTDSPRTRRRKPVLQEQKRARKGSRLAEDWVLPRSWGQWAMEQFQVTADQVRAEAQRFKDHWLAKAGKDAAKLDWYATWRNWCGSDIRSWKRRKAMTKKIAPDLLDSVHTEMTELERDLAEARAWLERK